MEILIIWTILALLVAAAAPSRGRSFAAWALVGIILSPLIALLGLVLLPNVHEERQRQKERDDRLVEAMGARPAERENVADSIARLADLRDLGSITEAEYESKKAELLARL